MVADRRILVRVGSPKACGAVFHGIGGPMLVSAGALWDPRRRAFRAPAIGTWSMDVALDSAGFVAMTRHGGYPWTVDEYVALVVRGRFALDRPDDRDADVTAQGQPWAWWSAMDYCCEPSIAGDRRAVEERMALTVERYVDCLQAAQAWRLEGVTDLTDPMPVLQGRTPADYAHSAAELARAIDDAHDCTCPAGDDDCDAEWHREHAGLPALVGVGSVCRRPLHGPEGLLAVVGELDRVLPPHVRLHLFGVKSAAVARLAHHPRIVSVDSQAWGTAARREALDRGVSCDVALKLTAIDRWRTAQLEAARPAQLPLL